MAHVTCALNALPLVHRWDSVTGLEKIPAKSRYSIANNIGQLESRRDAYVVEIGALP